MISKRLIFTFCILFGLSFGGFLLLNSAALGSQDGGSGAPGWVWLELPLHYVLLQPLAHWVLQAVTITWWTWQGLLALAALFALNSVIGAGLVVRVMRQTRSWRTPA